MWFKRKQSSKPSYLVCARCRVHFDPPTWEDPEDPCPDLCAVCGKDQRDRASRKRRVIRWAGENWERLEARAKKETKASERLTQAAMDQAYKSKINAEYSRNLSAMGFSGIVPYKR